MAYNQLNFKHILLINHRGLKYQFIKVLEKPALRLIVSSEEDS